MVVLLQGSRAKNGFDPLSIPIYGGHPPKNRTRLWSVSSHGTYVVFVYMWTRLRYRAMSHTVLV